jgi:HAD superfamily hydrolase (TIGR01509 family)
MKLSAVVFDVDGLMADSEPLHRAAWHELGRQCGFPTYATDAAESLGQRVIENLERRHAQGRFTDAPAVMLDRYHAILIGLIRERLQPKKGLREALDFVAVAGLRCGTASSGDRIYIDVVLDVLNIRRYFQAIATGEEVAEGKPDPALYVLAAARLETPPSDCVAFEDSPRGVKAAKAAGMRCVAVPEGSNTIPEADAECESLLAAIDVLRQWTGR